MNISSFFRIALLCTVTLGVVQCKNAEQDRLDSKPQGNTITIKASLEQPGSTKTALSADMKVLWTAGDQIKVYNAGNTSGIVFTLSDGAGTTQGSFTGTVPSGEGPYFAVYPASAGGDLSGSSIAVTLPSHQTFAEGSFGPGAALSAAKANTISNLVFKNVLGGVSFTVSGEKAKNLSGIRLQAKGNDALWGSASLNLSGETPAIEMDPATIDNGILSLDGINTSSAVFCLMLPPGTFREGYFVEFMDTEGNVMFKSASASGVNTVERSKILAMPESHYAAQYKAAFFETECFGFFPSISAEHALDASLMFDEADSQYAYKTEENRMVRVMSLSRGFYTVITTPKEMNLGEGYSVNLTSVVGSTKTVLSDKNYKVFKKTADRVWLVNEAEGTGIIQKLED